MYHIVFMRCVQLTGAHTHKCVCVCNWAALVFGSPLNRHTALWAAILGAASELRPRVSRLARFGREPSLAEAWQEQEEEAQTNKRMDTRGIR